MAVLLEELQEVIDWRMLGAYLNVPVHVLNKINIEHDGVVEHCKMFFYFYFYLFIYLFIFYFLICRNALRCNENINGKVENMTGK